MNHKRKQDLSNKLGVLANNMRDIACDMRLIKEPLYQQHSAELSGAAGLVSEWEFEIKQEIDNQN